MKDRRRDLLLYIPALEATLVYDPTDNKVHVLSDRQNTAGRLADRFSLIGFDKPLSKQPVDAVSYELAMFKNWIDLKAAKATGALIEDAWISALTVTLGHTRHSVTITLASRDVDVAAAGQSEGLDCRCHRTAPMDLWWRQGTSRLGRAP